MNRYEAYDRLLEMSKDDESLVPVVELFAQVGNGGFDQWRDNTLYRHPSWGDLAVQRFAGAAAELEHRAGGAAWTPSSQLIRGLIGIVGAALLSIKRSKVLDHLTTAFYGFGDLALVAFVESLQPRKTETEEG